MFHLKLIAYSYSTVLELIQEINEFHRSFSVSAENLLTYNLKNTVDQVTSEEGISPFFQELIEVYKLELNKYSLKLLGLQSRYPGMRYRIKQLESIREKLLYYMTAEHEFGKVSINKSLNDFLGFRIFVNDLHNIQGRLMNDTNLKTLVRMYVRRSGNYVGMHLYFKNGNNKFFPWELQIWQIDQAAINEKSHQDHKQKRKYITIAHNYLNNNFERR